MSHLTEMEDSNTKELIFPCECGDWHYLRMRWEVEENGDGYSWRSMWVEDVATSSHHTPWKTRVKQVWNLLRRGVVCSSEILLTEQSLRNLHAFIEVTVLEKPKVTPQETFTPCSNCNTSFEDCDKILLKTERPCCARCYTTDTHKALVKK